MADELLTQARGPFVGGYTSAIPPFFAKPEQLVGEPGGSDTNSSRDVNIDPFTGGVSKRGPCAIQNDTVTAGNVEVSGLLNARFGAKSRKLFALDSPSMTDNYPVPAILYGEDTNAGFPTADSGFPGTLFVASSNGGGLTDAQKRYSLLEEFGAVAYKSGVSGVGGNPVYGSTDFKLKVVPIWIESGDGVYNRGALTGTAGTDQFMQQFLTCGSRGGVQDQWWYYSPNLRCTPWRWNKRLNEQTASTSEINRIYPTGPLPPLFPPRYDSTSLPTAADGSSWVQGDTFFVSVLFQFADGSYSAPFIPRAINPVLTTGLGLVTVGAISATPTLKYPYIVYRNIPIGPEGTVARVLLRSPKQNRTASTDTITVSPLDLRVIGVLKNNTQDAFIDYNGDDKGLLEDDDVVRVDYQMPRRARYIGTGDQRVVISHTLPNTAAILLSLINVNGGGALNYDLNVPDTSDVPYSDAEAHLVRITSTDLELHYNPVGAPVYDTAPTYSGTLNGNAVKFPFATYTTLGAMVDAINKTTGSSNCEQWGAQLAPGIDDTMPSSYLTLTTMAITSTTSFPSNTTTVTSSALFGPVGVGMRVSGTGITAGTYVVSKASASSLTISTGATAAGAVSLTFYQETGDNAIVTGGTLGYMRCFGPNLPILLHVKPSALPDYAVADKAAVHFTTSSPGANSSGTSMAPNSWLAGNKRVPVSSSRSVMKRSCTGIVDMEGTAVIAYSDGIYMLKNVRGANTGEDEDMRLFTINEGRGCVSYLGLVSGNAWAAYPTPEGIFACDKTGREFTVSGDVFNPSDNMGDLAYELKTSAASAASDSDDQYLSMAVMGSKLAVSYRNTAASAGRGLLLYDFSPGIEASGVEELIEPTSKRPYIWSPPHVHNPVGSVNVPVGAMGSIRNASGRIDYIAFDGNLGTNDGRFDRLNATTTWGGTTITVGDNNLESFFGYAIPAPLVPQEFMSLLPQDCEVTHLSTTGGASILYYANDQTPSFVTTAGFTSALPATAAKTRYQKQIVPIAQGLRGRTDMFWARWRAAADASTTTRLYRIVFRYKESEATVLSSS